MTPLGASFVRLVAAGGHGCNGMLSSLTPRLVRSEVENKLGVPSGTLDAAPYKALVKRTIHDATVCASLILFA
jgi:predicted secreted protein